MSESSITAWLSDLRHSTETYEPLFRHSGGSELAVIFRHQERVRMMGKDEKRTSSGPYINLWELRSVDVVPKVKFAEERVVSAVFHECEEEVEFVKPVKVENVEIVLTKNVIEWICNLYCSSEDEEEHFDEEILETCNEFQKKHGDSPVPKPAFPTANEAEDVPEVSLRSRDKGTERQSKTICDYSSLTQRPGKVKPIVLNGEFTITGDGVTTKNHTGKIEITGSKIVFKKANDKVKREENLWKIEETPDGGWKYWTSLPKEPDVHLQRTIKKSRIEKGILKKLMQKRSTKNLLEKKGILKQEDIFGNNLAALQKKFESPIPPFVYTIIDYIEHEANIRTEHIYRISGNMATIQKIRLDIDNNKISVLNNHKNDVEVLTGTLKLFYRELVDPLIPYKDFEKLSKISNKPDNEERHKSVYDIVENVSSPHRENIKLLINHLLRVESHNSFNKMTLKSLAIVWGPSMIWYQKDKCPHHNAFEFSMLVNHIVEMTLVAYKARTPEEQHEDRIRTSKELTTVNEEKISRSISDDGNPKNRENSKLGSFFGMKRTESKDKLTASSWSLTSFNNSESKKASSENPFYKYTLESLPTKEFSLVPDTIVELIAQIDKKPETRDLYIRTASKDYMTKFRKKAAKSKPDFSKLEPLDLAIILVKILRELDDALIPESVFSDFCDNFEQWSMSQKYAYVEKSLRELDHKRQEILNAIMNHLCVIFQHQPLSRSNILNVWLPVICVTTSIDELSSTFNGIIFDIYERRFAARDGHKKNFEYRVLIPNQESTNKAEPSTSEPKLFVNDNIKSNLSNAQLSDISNSIGRTVNVMKYSNQSKHIGVRKPEN